jgi:hypothetical protein
MATLNLPLGVGKERALCCRVVCLGGFVGHSSGSVFAWIILRGVSLGFFAGSRFFFLLGLGGLVGGFLGLVWVLLGFFFLYSGVTIGGSFVL